MTSSDSQFIYGLLPLYLELGGSLVLDVQDTIMGSGLNLRRPKGDKQQLRLLQ
jgi:hypothetical protein